MEKVHEDKGETVVYEIGYHLVPTLSEDEVALRVGDIQKLVSQKGGSVIAEEFPEIMELAYTMKKMIAGKWEKYDQAYFGWIKLETTPEDAQALNEELRTLDFVLRFLLVKTVRENTMSVRVLARKEAGETAAPEAEKGPIVEAEVDKAIEELVKE